MQAASPYYSLGIDIGGTFTDLVLYDEERGSYRSHKELTTPQDPTESGVYAQRREEIRRDKVDAHTLGRRAVTEGDVCFALANHLRQARGP